MSHILGMDDIELIERTVGSRDCLSLKWRKISIGLIFEENSDNWRISTDLKGEFWALEEFNDKDAAIQALIDKKTELDNFRIQQLSGQQ
jgi:hypothetical protein